LVQTGAELLVRGEYVAWSIGLAGSALALQGPAWIGALLIGILLVSLVDPQRFYSADPRPRPSRR
jgi:hypothetical protein